MDIRSYAATVKLLSAIATSLVVFGTTPLRAQGTPTWRLNTAIEGKERPFLCQDLESVGLIIAIERRALLQNDPEKSTRLSDIARRLEGELCRAPAPDDTVILRCKLDQHDTPNAQLSTVRVSALIRAELLKGEQPFFAWTLAPIEDSPGNPKSQKANDRWCGDQEGADELLQPVADLVLRIQNRLYDFGLPIPQINGQMNSETVRSLIQFQKWAGILQPAK